EGLTLRGGFAITPEGENLHEVHFTIPPGWQVAHVTAADGTALPSERFPLGDGATRVAVRLPKGIQAGQTQTINYQATHMPADWLDEAKSQTVAFPKVLVEGATSESGAVAVQAVDDRVVRPDTLSGLTPLLDNEKAAF